MLLNTGATAENIAEYLKVADGAVVGSTLKVDGITWNRLDPERIHWFADAASSV